MLVKYGLRLEDRRFGPVFEEALHALDTDVVAVARELHALEARLVLRRQVALRKGKCLHVGQVAVRLRPKLLTRQLGE